MNRWRRLPFTLLALWAMLLTLAPQMAWACSMTGRVDVAERVCLEASPMAQSEMAPVMPCASSCHKCCKPVQIPASHRDDWQHGQFLVAAADYASFSPAFLVSTFHIVAVLPAFRAALSPVMRFYLARFNNSPPLFWTQHRPLSLVGRAPPFL